jgi:hypothetical protein
MKCPICEHLMTQRLPAAPGGGTRDVGRTQLTRARPPRPQTAWMLSLAGLPGPFLRGYASVKAMAQVVAARLVAINSISVWRGRER